MSTILVRIAVILSIFSSGLYSTAQTHTLKLGCLYANDFDGEGLYYNRITGAWNFAWSHFSSIEYQYKFKGSNHLLSFNADGFSKQYHTGLFETREKHLATLHKRSLGLLSLNYGNYAITEANFQFIVFVGIVRRYGTGTLDLYSIDYFGGGKYSAKFIPINSTGINTGIEINRTIAIGLFVFSSLRLAYFTDHAPPKYVREKSVNWYESQGWKIKVTPSNNSFYFKWGIGYQFGRKNRKVKTEMNQ